MTLKKICDFACAGSIKNLDLALLLLRISAGASFIYHGWAKVSSMEGTIAMFGTMGIGVMLTYIASYVEFIGGIALLVGAGTRLVGWLLAVFMVVAIWLVHFQNGFNTMTGGYEFQLLLLVTVIGLALVGPGKYSVHDKICKDAK